MNTSSGFRPALFLALILCLTACSTANAAVAIVPDSEQAAPALKIIDAYHDPRPASPPKKLRVLYFTPADRDPVPDYEKRLEAIMEDIRTFYREGMKQQGFGPKTFDLERDAQGKFIIHLVKGKKSKEDYARLWKDRRRIIGGECQAVLEAAGLSFSNETVAVICNLADWDDKTHEFSHPTPYSGVHDNTGGYCWLMDSPILNSQ